MANVVAQNSEQPEFKGDPKTAKRFFDRAAEVALTKNYDYAMELYRDGIKWDPDSLETGHKPLFELGLKRKLSGGKGIGLRDQAAFRRVTVPNERLAWASYLMARDPDNVRAMEHVLQSAVKIDARLTVKWIAVRLVGINRDSDKPSLDRFVLVTDAFEKIEAFDEAVTTCEMALKMKPNDLMLNTKLKNLMALKTMQAGKYQTATDFKDSLNNAKKQMNQQDDLRVVTTEDIVDRQIRDAREDLAKNPGAPGKINALVELLTKRGREEEEADALGILQDAFTASNSYRFRERLGEIKIRQYQRKASAAVEALRADPNNAQLKEAALKITKEFRSLEEQEYAERVTNYPTDLGLKFEYARRLFLNHKFDEAIPVLQQAESDPKNRLRAKSLLGQAFFSMKFYNEAVDTFKRAIEEIEVGGNDVAKELYYNLGRALEQMGKVPDADAAYSQVMQWDFNYKDVRPRIQKLRNPPAA